MSEPTGETTILVGYDWNRSGKCIGIAAFRFDQESRRVWVAEPIVWTERPKGEEENAISSVLSISRQEAQRFMDELWKFGIRPSDQGSPGQLAAIRKHLEDMRAITFGKLKVPMPEEPR